jgi:hypothetical protein
MRRLLLAVVLALTTATVAVGAVSASDLGAADVVFDEGVTRSAADRERLEATSRELAGQGFRTKFVVVANRVDDIDKLARDLRRGVGLATVEAVLVLGPRQLGLDAKVFDCEKQLAFDAEVETLRSDDVQGTINVANRLLEFNKAQALRDADCNEIDGPTKESDGVSKLLIGVLVAAGLVGLAAIVLVRRAVKRNEHRRAADQTDDGPSGAADAPDDDGGAEREALDP